MLAGLLICFGILITFGLYCIDCGLTEIAHNVRALRRDGGSES